MAGNKLYLEPILDEFITPLNDNIDELIPIINAQVNDINIQTCEIEDEDVIISNVPDGIDYTFGLKDPPQDKLLYNDDAALSLFTSFCTGLLKLKFKVKRKYSENILNGYNCLIITNVKDKTKVIGQQWLIFDNYIANTEIEHEYEIKFPVQAGETYFITAALYYTASVITGPLFFSCSLDETYDNIIYFKRFDALENVPIIY